MAYGQCYSKGCNSKTRNSTIRTGSMENGKRDSGFTTDSEYYSDSSTCPGEIELSSGQYISSGEERTGWELAMMEITKERGPFQEDPWGFIKEPTATVETLEWRDKRSLLVPPTNKIPETLDLLEQMGGSPPETPPIAWERMAMIVTPLWKGTSWWPRLEKIREY